MKYKLTYPFLARSFRMLVALGGLTAFASPGGWANDTTVGAEPVEAPVARFGGNGKATSVSWYFTSDSPRKERQVAQTIQAEQDGGVKHLALGVTSDALSGLGQDAIYELKVYEAPNRPDRAFISRNVVLEQQGTVTDGEGGWLIFPFAQELHLKAGHFYTFALSFTTPSGGNKVLFSQSPADPGAMFRWHRSGRDSWVPSPLSLHFVLY